MTTQLFRIGKSKPSIWQILGWAKDGIPKTLSQEERLQRRRKRRERYRRMKQLCLVLPELIRLSPGLEERIRNEDKDLEKNHLYNSLLDALSQGIRKVSDLKIVMKGQGSVYRWIDLFWLGYLGDSLGVGWHLRGIVIKYLLETDTLGIVLQKIGTDTFPWLGEALYSMTWEREEEMLRESEKDLFLSLTENYRGRVGRYDSEFWPELVVSVWKWREAMEGSWCRNRFALLLDEKMGQIPISCLIYAANDYAWWGEQGFWVIEDVWRRTNLLDSLLTSKHYRIGWIIDYLREGLEPYSLVPPWLNDWDVFGGTARRYIEGKLGPLTDDEFKHIVWVGLPDWFLT